MSHNPARTFRDIDTSGALSELTSYLDVAARSMQLQRLREEMTRRLPKGRGRGLDLGCGTGEVVHELSRAGFDICGVDRSEAMIEAAKQRYPRCRFFVGEAASLPFDEGSFDWYQAERVFLHLDHPGWALAEARRVLKPRGFIMLADTDFATVVADSANAQRTRLVFDALMDLLTDGRAGIRHRANLAAAGFHDIASAAIPLIFTDIAEAMPLFLQPAQDAAVQAGVLTADEGDEWIADLRARAAKGTFILSCTVFLTQAIRT
jgi:ubiquinone/menaquinone biosynthesis C-methylase UbiE